MMTTSRGAVLPLGGSFARSRSHQAPGVVGCRRRRVLRAPPPPRAAAAAPLSRDADDLLHAPLGELAAAAAAVRDAHYAAVTFSPKVFIPLTRLCRDACGYCTFAAPPAPGRRAFMTVDEAVAVAAAGAAAGATEALFTLGDAPEARWPEAAAELAALGFASTLEYVAHAARAVLERTGVLPHVNAGLATRAQFAALKAASASAGLMLESTSPALLLPGGAHDGCATKAPAARLAALEAAGEAGVPFTTGLLVGIGERRADRLAALAAIAAAHARHGHVQEVIVQNFRAKTGTRMAGHPEPDLEELLWTVAAARLVLPPGVSLQAPPNLTPEADDAAPAPAGGDGAEEGWRRLLGAGVNDWGGVSPLTRDWVNPERPWPHLERLAAATVAATGLPLLPRLPVYPAFLQEAALGGRPWLDGTAGRRSPLAAALAAADADGLVRGSAWCAGAAEQQPQELGGGSATLPSSAGRQPAVEAAPPPPRAGKAPASPPLPAAARRRAWAVAIGADGLLEGAAAPPPSARVAALLARAAATGGEGLSEADVAALLRARGADFAALVAAADAARAAACGDDVTYVVNRNINYTNVCTLACSFCAFSKGRAAEAARGPAYLLPLDEISRRVAEAWARGATEVCMQGGIHPDFDGRTYLDILAAAKAAAPGVHVHAFSPLEVSHGAASLGWPLPRYLDALAAAGLGSLPGTAAEVLDDAVRARLCPDKLSAAEWLAVAEAAHAAGLKTTSTLMFGHVDGHEAWARHLLALRGLAARTGGITEFVPLPYVHMEAPMYARGRSRRGPTLREAVAVHAVARLVLAPHVRNIQASWVKMGPKHAAGLLAAGCNDMGGVLMNESITRAAGAAHGQQLAARDMEALIRGAGRAPRQRTTLYGAPDAAQAARALEAANQGELARV